MSKKEMLGIVGVLTAAILAAVIVLAILGSPIASAEPAQQFSMRLRAERVDGPVSFTIVMRSFDTTGLVPPAPVESYLRLPRGAGIRKEFLNPRWYCDGPALRSALDARPSRTPFNQRVANLVPFIRSLARGETRADRAALANARVCERARLSRGTGLIDARDAIRVLTDPIPVGFSVFLSRPEAPSAVTGVTIIGAADERSAVVERYPVVGGVHVAIGADMLDDPTPDGLYGLRVRMPTGPINGFDVRIAEVDMTVRSLVIRRGTCLARRGSGRCSRRQPADLHSFLLPACPPTGALSAMMFTGFAPPTPSLTTTFQLPCPRFAA